MRQTLKKFRPEKSRTAPTNAEAAALAVRICHFMFKRVNNHDYIQNFQVLKILVVPHRKIFHQTFPE